MSAASVGSSSLDAYREEVDGFMAALDEEFYLHYAGLKDDFQLEPIYERYADLVTLESCDRLRSIAEVGSRGERELWRFACEGYIGSLTRPETETIARLEASLTAELDGESLPYRMVRPTMANEPNRDRRQRLEEMRVELSDEHLNPHHVAAAEKRREACPGLGAPTYTALYDRFRFPLAELAEQAQRFLSDTEDLYVALLDPIVRRRIGLGLEDARRWDVPRLFRAPEWDERFPADAMLPALTQTLAELGIDLRSQENVVLDVEARPKKSPRAFCAPIEIPDRVMLVIQPVGGPDDWHSLFHEAGHAEHFAHTSRDLRVEERRLGDAALGEGWAMLLELLVNDPAWLARRLDFGRADEFASEGAAMLLYLVRRYAGKYLYELELNGDSELADMRGRYVELMREATKIEPSPADYLADVDAGFYSSSYLRAWAFESRLRAFFREQFGYGWLASREAGSLLRELWTEGQRMTADEILQEVVGAEVELDAVADRVKEVART